MFVFFSLEYQYNRYLFFVNSYSWHVISQWRPGKAIITSVYSPFVKAVLIPLRYTESSFVPLKSWIRITNHIKCHTPLHSFPGPKISVISVCSASTVPVWRVCPYNTVFMNQPNFNRDSLTAAALISLLRERVHFVWYNMTICGMHVIINVWKPPTVFTEKKKQGGPTRGHSFTEKKKQAGPSPVHDRHQAHFWTGQRCRRCPLSRRVRHCATIIRRTGRSTIGHAATALHKN
jgi:hypothetical protein